MNKYLRLLVDKDYRFAVLTQYHICDYKWLSDEDFTRRFWKLTNDTELDLKDPKTFNEKLQWLKLYYRNPEYVPLVDKYEAKKVVADIIGEEHIIPTLGVWDRFDDIDFDALPDQFVLKCTHDSGGLVVVRDKSKLDIKAARKKINKSLKRNFYWYSREWQYRNIPPRIIAEQYVSNDTDNENGELTDYKFFCFNGEAKAMFIATDRQSGEEVKFDFFDMDFNRLNIKNGHPNSTKEIARPKAFDEMRALAETLSVGMPQVRVDFYEVDGKVYFGEMTFTHHSAVMPFEPDEWNKIFGDWIDLPEKSQTADW